MASGDIGQAAAIADQAIAVAKENENAVYEGNSRLESAAAQLRESSSAVREAGESVSAAADAAVQGLDSVDGQIMSGAENLQPSAADAQVMEQVVNAVGGLRDSSELLAEKRLHTTGGVKAAAERWQHVETGA